jgi:hypothetical protein
LTRNRLSRWDLNQSHPSVVSVQALSLQRCTAAQWEGGVSAAAGDFDIVHNGQLTGKPFKHFSSLSLRISSGSAFSSHV